MNVLARWAEHLVGVIGVRPGDRICYAGASTVSTVCLVRRIPL
ncbi:hypothetical protein OHB12_15055 [Nocardia sp. NBC_01730]|nr:hypothetical protein OHB12_15055 [Nocardia sp. NBC_01730]